MKHLNKIKPFSRYMAILFMTVLLCFTGCHFWEDTIIEEPDTDPNSLVTAISFTLNTISVNKGEKANFKVNINPGDIQNIVDIEWECGKDESGNEIIKLTADNYGAIVEGVKAGSTWIKAKCNDIVATCLVSVISNGDDVEIEPYIYSSDSVIEMLPDTTYTLIASLYGGSIEDMENFKWEVKNPSVAEIVPGRNNCVVKTKLAGSTVVTATHPKARYEYTFIIYCYTDKLTIPYITTLNNVLTIDKNENSSKNIKVDLMNSYTSSYINDFTFSYGDEQSKNIIEFSSSQNECEVRALNNGIAKIKVSHPQTEYSLNIIVRVNTIVKNTYIGLSQSTLVINGSDGIHSVTANIENYDGFVNLEKFTFNVPSEASSIMDYSVHGNVISIQGKKNGKVNITVGHELSEYTRTLLVILQEQVGSAIDSSMYITTDQNYIQTKVGDPVTRINVRLVGGIDGEDNVGDDTQNFKWWVTGNYLNEQQKNDFVEFQQHTGSIASRSAATSGNICPAYIDIKPVLEGEFTIHVSHPRCIYETEIKVKVLSEYALTEPPIKITTSDSIIKLIKGQEKTIEPVLENGSDALKNTIEYSSDDVSKITVNPSVGPSSVIKAVGDGSNQNYVTVHLDNALADKKILVLSAETQEALDSMKAMYCDVSYARLTAGTTGSVSLNLVGFEDSDINSINFASLDSGIVILNKDSVNNNSDGTKTVKYNLNGISKGRTNIKASYSGCPDVVIEVTVLPVGEVPEVNEEPRYLTTNMNAVVIEQTDGTGSAELNVIGVNIQNQTGYVWSKEELTETAPSYAFTLMDNHINHATIRAEKAGKSVVKVSHPESNNTVEINVKCGSLLEWTDGYIPYIVCENGEDVVNIINGQSKTIACSIANSTSTGFFNWSVSQGTNKIDITGTTNGTCTITGKEAGQSIIVVSNSIAGDVTKEILVNVANSQEELVGFKYLTTTSNVVNVNQGQSTTVSVEVINSNLPVLSGYNWTSTDTSKVTVTGSGNTALITGKEIGTAKINVTNNDCEIPLEIIVNVINPVAADLDPYISCPNIVTCTVGGEEQDISAEIIGRNESQNTGFTWSVEDSTIATVYGSNSSAKIKAVKEGVTRVVVQHPSASVARRILVICEPKIETNCYITVPESIIKMSPSDSVKSISATLVNGNQSDIYGFKWWADDYKIISMNAAQNECSITPIASGTVNIHVSHPKADNVKDIVLYISQYNDFAFSTNSIQLDTGGSDSFIQMEVPATGVDCLVSFESSDTNICTAWGNTTVCNLHPGNKEGSCRITAYLKTKGGSVQATAELLVATVKKNETSPYIGLDGQTVVSFNIDETRKLSAQLYGDNLIDSTGSGLRWEIANEYQNIIAFTSNQYTDNPSFKYVKGKECQIKAINNGKAVLKITHEDDNGRKVSPLLIYIIVNGTSEPTVTLNWPSLYLYTGEDAAQLVATVLNSTGEQPVWTITQTPDDTNLTECCSVVTNGLKTIVTPNKPGKVDVVVTLQSNGSTARCSIVVEEPPRLDFFVYDTVDGQTVERVIDNFNVYPGKSKNLYYKSVPKVKEIKSGTAGHYLSDSHRISCDDKGYGYNGVPANVGTVIVTGASMESETPVYYKLTTVENVEKSVTITNNYNYQFSVSQTALTMTVNEALNKEHIKGLGKGYLGPITYKVTPSCAEIRLKLSTTIGNIALMKNIPKIYYRSSNGSLVQAESKGNYQYVIKNHKKTDPATETGEGEIILYTDGEFFGNLTLTAVNTKVVSGSGETEHPIGNNIDIALSWYYTKHNFAVSRNTCDGNYSSYDKNTNCITLGDGEKYVFNVYSTDTKADMHFDSASFVRVNSGIKDNNSNVQSDLVNGQGNNVSNNAYICQLTHSKDYNSTNGFYARNGTEPLAAYEINNKTVKEYSYVGYIKVENTVLDGSIETFKIPVYVEVRNISKNQ